MMLKYCYQSIDRSDMPIAGTSRIRLLTMTLALLSLLLTACRDSNSPKSENKQMATDHDQGSNLNWRTAEFTKSDELKYDADYVGQMMTSELDSGALSIDDLVAGRFEPSKYMSYDGIFTVHYASVEQIGISVRSADSELPEVSSWEEMKIFLDENLPDCSNFIWFEHYQRVFFELENRYAYAPCVPDYYHEVMTRRYEESNREDTKE